MKWSAYGPRPCFGLLLAAIAVACHAESMKYVYTPPESTLDRRYLYQWRILETALERTRGAYGDFTLAPAVQMSESRQAYELEQDSGRLTVMYRDWFPEYEKTLVAVHIPVDKSLAGYRIFLIRDAERGRFQSVRTLSDLKPFRFGLGADWIDVRIFRQDGLRVVTGTNYEGLFDMLANGRFDIFSRGATEALAEYEDHKAGLPGIEIEQALCVYYPAAVYFWFASSDHGRLLAARAERGMRMMIDDGAYDRIFDEFFDATIEKLDLRHRRVIRIANPFLDPQAPLSDHRLWYDPEAGAASTLAAGN